ncbi:MAG: PAS domain-containing protein [Anaerolineae bacterium]|nr:PAS domain-containing protein [Anaerolineae bacterium]
MAAASKQKHAKAEAHKHKQRVFISGRLRILAGLGGVLVLITTLSAYLVTIGVASDIEQAQTAQLTAAIDGAMQGIAAFEAEHIEALNLVRGTYGVPQFIIADDGRAMQRLIEPLAANAGLNSVVIADLDGREILGLQRVGVNAEGVIDPSAIGGPVDYAVSAGTDLAALPMVSAFMWGDVTPADRPVGLAQTPQGYAIYTAGPVMKGDEVVGVALVGSTLTEVAGAVQAHALTNLAFYLPDGELLAATFSPEAVPDLQPDPEAIQAALQGAVLMRTLQIGGCVYRAGYAPFVVRGQVVGVVGVFIPNNVFTATETGRRLLSLGAASIAAAVLTGALVMVTAVYTRRLARIRDTVDAIGAGDLSARTGMSAHDEVSALGESVDAMATSINRRMELLALALRAQRRETVRLNAVLESVPDGIVVQDHDGRVLLMNETARQMFGSRRVFRDSSMNMLTAVVTDKLGPMLAPGIYALGTPVRAVVNNRVLEAQAAAVTVESKKQARRIGTVIVLRDVTAEARGDLAREELINRIADQVYRVANATAKAYAAPLGALVQGMRENTVSLERMIGELRELSTLDRDMLRMGARPLAVKDFVGALVNDWKPAIERAGLNTNLLVMSRDLFILADERRLRWALGNIIDNAVKYTPRGGRVDITVAKGEGATVDFIVSDSGVGIDEDDLPFVWQRFFRGTPRRRDGQVVRRPGSGQGLYIARRVVEAHGGSVKLDSWVHAGTDVRVALPLVVAEPVQGWPGAGRASAEIDTGRYTVKELRTMRLDDDE